MLSGMSGSISWDSNSAWGGWGSAGRDQGAGGSAASSDDLSGLPGATITSLSSPSGAPTSPTIVVTSSSKIRDTPASLSESSRGFPGRTGSSTAWPPGTRSVSRQSGGYIAHEFCNLRRDVHHVTNHDDRGRPDPFLCDTAFHMF